MNIWVSQGDFFYQWADWVLGLDPEDSRGADNKTVLTGGNVMKSKYNNCQKGAQYPVSLETVVGEL